MNLTSEKYSKSVKKANKLVQQSVRGYYKIL